MNEIYLTKLDTPEQERANFIEKLDEIFKDVQLVVSIHSWDNQYYPIKSIKHFIENSPTYKAESKNLIVWFSPYDSCLVIKNVKTCRCFCIRLATKEYLKDFPYIYEGKLDNKNDYIIPIKFK
jgi:hypothetical protein